MIDIWIDGRNLGTRGAGFSVYMQCGKRELKCSYKTKKFTSNQLEMKAVEFAIKCIKPEFINEKILIRSSGRFAILMLEKHNNEWFREPKFNPSLIKEVRDHWSKFSDLKINTDVSSKIMNTLKEMTDSVVKSGENVFIQS